MKKWKKHIGLSAFIGSIFSTIFYFGNNIVKSTQYTITSNKVNDKELKIILLSDLHGKKIENIFSSLKNKIAQVNPDLIFLTGDIIENSATNLPRIIRYLNSLKASIPLYYVSGNHDVSLEPNEFNKLHQALNDIGCHSLDNKEVEIEVDGIKIRLVGLIDMIKENTSIMKERLSKIEKSEKLTLLLSHRCNFVEEYNDSVADFTFTGHGHGGMFGLGHNLSLYAPGQGFFPKNFKGVHSKTIISRGIGNSRFTFRLFNRPELVIVTIKKAA